MAPTNPYLSNQLRNLIYYHLDNNLIKNALFLATRLHACEPRYVDGSYLLALCYLRLGQYKSAYEHSRVSGSRGVHLGCAYVYAQACLELGKWQDGITALERSRSLWGTRNNLNRHSETARKHLPDAAAIFCLLGKLWYSYDSVENAVDCFVDCLKLNPFMWDAFTGLCDTGVDVRVSNIFNMSPEMISLLYTGAAPTSRSASTVKAEDIPRNIGPLQTQMNSHNLSANMADPFGISYGQGDEDNSLMLAEAGSASLYQKINEKITPQVTSAVSITGNDLRAISEVNTPMVPSAAIPVDVTVDQHEPPRAPMRKARAIPGQVSDLPMGTVPRMRPTLIKPRAGIRTAEHDDISDSTVASRATSSMLPSLDRKRAFSGQVTRTKATEVDPNAAAQRRSPRFLSQMRPSSRRLLSAATSIKDSKDIKKVKATGTKGRLLSGTTVSRAGSSRHPDEMDIDGKDPIRDTQSGRAESTKPASLENAKQEEALQYLLDLFKELAIGHFALCHFSCEKALKYFDNVSHAQRDTPWVIAQIAKCYFEQSKWTEAAKYFAHMREMAPTRVEDTEIYSTCLWFLKKDVELAHLAHELMDLDRLAPQSWCALGNSFSLRKDHDQAVKCFKRATQLDTRFAYAYTLQGHEHMLNEEFEKAEMAYRSAMTADNRHYNAWYGLGKVNERLGKLEMAEKHFRTAAKINSSNAVLVCCIGMVLERMKNPRAALIQYNLACELAPKSALSRYRKARVLMQLQELELAKTELLALKELAPDEANVHFLLGKLFKMLHQKANAIKHFTSAFQLDPKAGGLIKEAMESLEDPDEDDEQHPQ